MRIALFTPWADAVSQSLVLGIVAALVFGGVLFAGYWLLSRWLD